MRGERPPPPLCRAPLLSPLGAGRAALRHEGDRAAGGPGQRYRSVCPECGAAGAGPAVRVSVYGAGCGGVRALPSPCPPAWGWRGSARSRFSQGPGPAGACVCAGCVCGALCAALPGGRGLAHSCHRLLQRLCVGSTVAVVLLRLCSRNRTVFRVGRDPQGSWSPTLSPAQDIPGSHTVCRGALSERFLGSGCDTGWALWHGLGAVTPPGCRDTAWALC